MKIALITYHRPLNYGAVLQTYATCEILKRFGHEVLLIDVRIHQYHNVVRRFISYLNDNVKRYKFYRFRKRYYPPTTRKYSSMSELRKNPPIADMYIVGSDQVFNTHISGKMAAAFFLDFGPDSIKRLSFSSSFGEEHWYPTSSLSLERAKNLLKRFSSITVREESACRICRKVFDREARLTIDPTLLLYDFSSLMDIHEPVNMIVSYCFGYDTYLNRWVKEIAKRENLMIRHLYKTLRYSLPFVQNAASVETWIQMIANAKYVVTDSFHGVVFCLIYHKQFVVLSKNGRRMTRIYNILSLLKMEDRIFLYGSKSSDKILEILHKQINYEEKDAIICELRDNSIQLLKRNIVS